MKKFEKVAATPQHPNWGNMISREVPPSFAVELISNYILALETH